MAIRDVGGIEVLINLLDTDEPKCKVQPLHGYRLYKVKKVKFSHTRYRALGPELIPVYRQSARR